MRFLRAAIVALLLGAAVATPALAASPVRCRLAPHQPSPSTTNAGNVVVTVPKLICPGDGRPAQTGGQAANSSGGSHGGVLGGTLPFTGAEIALLVLVAVAVAGGGLVIKRAGRPKTATTTA